ncbi:type IV pilin protein [Neptuniibacter sp. SY11_33]|uniref:type IV pilin protein n=1 Tax=Neptuniibacter sp. SY11_33 TaxID=3398215 RepID=UPI0039F46451
MNRVHKEKGFSLIELMIAIAVVGILASIAYPSYQAQIADGRRADAQANLLSLVQHMEREFTENGTYIGASLPYNEAPRDGNAKFYDLSLASQAATTYIILARPKNVMAGDECGDMTIDNIGRKTAGAADCW